MARGIESPGCGGHFVRVDVFPGGIDFETFEHATSLDIVKTRVDQLRNLFKDKLVIVSNDRVDEIEGVPLKLHVIEKFLLKYPQWKGKVVYFQVTQLLLLLCTAFINSCIIKIYEPQGFEQESEGSKALAREVNEIVGRMNGVFGSVNYVPIEYMHKNISFEEICALYSVAHVALVTPIRDGLNIISHEYPNQ